MFAALVLSHFGLQVFHMAYVMTCSENAKCPAPGHLINAVLKFPLGYLIMLLPKPTNDFAPVLPFWSYYILIPLNSVAFVGISWWLVQWVARARQRSRQV